MARRKSNRFLEADDKFEITAMIDVVFLLLIYFMFLPIQQEADLGISLPSSVPPVENLELPTEQYVLIRPDGEVLLNGEEMGAGNSHELPELRERLALLKATSDRGGYDTVVIIDADPDSPHQRSIDVLNALKEAGVTMVSFSMNS